MKEREAVKVLASADRQLLVHELLRTGGEATETELARQVAARRHQTRPAKISKDTIERARIRLRHIHLPLLRDSNVIEWDGGTVVLTDDERRDHLLEVAEEFEDWPPDDRLQHPAP